MELKNRVVMITGSSHGIGKETAFRFAKEECRLVITYFKDKKAAEDVAQHCFELGAQATIVHQLNLMDSKSITSVSKSVLDKFGAVDFLINNAGVSAHDLLEDQSFEDIEQQLRTNLEGLIKLTNRFVGHAGLIINVGSGASMTGYSSLSVYCASKFGVRGFTESLVKEGISIKLVNPGRTATRMSDFEGRPASQVAEIIFRAATGRYKKWEVNVWDVTI